jgi:eukaryotic-like serine/threonine-protein kinase
MPHSAGEKLGPYEILALIGAGGMGEVYKARDPRLNRDVAIKISRTEFDERFEREAKACAALNHPHICQIYDVGPNYLVMEYLEGAPLKGPLPEAAVLKLAAQIAEALEAAHARGITHRDLKPANILVTAHGIKLVDFGIAKQAAPVLGQDETTFALTGAGMVVGTPAYMSPEQAQGLATDSRSDIFSFALVLYEMLSGRRAFAGETAVAILTAVVHKEPAPIEASPAMVRVLMRCLRKAPGDRYRSIADVKAALAELGETRAIDKPSIAVLPFANLSADKENEYFSDGLAEEILNALTQLPGLRVVARASAFAFRGREHAIAEIGEKLSVASVLNGSVRRSGNRIRVTAQLISVRDESQLWSERYDREMRDVFDIQDEIAQSIVEKLQVQLGTRAGQTLVKRYTENPAAHSLYLKGNFHLYHVRPEEMQKGKVCLEQAVALEPNHAPAWVHLAWFYIGSGFQGHASPRELWPKAKEAAHRAVTADPELAEAQGVAGMVAALSEYMWAEALSRFDNALRLNPASARTYLWLSQVQMAMGRSQECWDSTQRAVELDPLFVLYRSISAERLIFRGEYERAADYALQILDIDPEYAMARGILGQAYSRIGRHEEGIALLEKALETSSFYHGGFLSWAYVAAGRRGDAEGFVARLEEKRRRKHVPAATLAFAALGVGDVDGALAWIEEALGERDPNLIYIPASPDFEPLRSAPRFRSVVRQMNLG